MPNILQYVQRTQPTPAGGGAVARFPTLESVHVAAEPLQKLSKILEERDEEQARAVDSFRKLDPKVQHWLATMETENVDTLRYLATIPKTELQNLMKMFRDALAVSWFVRWGIVTLVGLFIGTVVLYENILKVIGWIKGPPPP